MASGVSTHGWQRYNLHAGNSPYVKAACGTRAANPLAAALFSIALQARRHMKLRVGLVGLGDTWESRRRLALRALSDRFEVRAVCDQVAHRAEQVAREFSAVHVDGYWAMARRDDIDALLMLAPQWFGMLPVLAACETGKAVYCASGLDWDLIQANNLKNQIESSGISFMAEFPRRHAPATLRLKELMATRLGRPRLLFCHMRIPTSKPRLNQHSFRTTSTPLNDLVELVDWCTFVVGYAPSSVVGVHHPDGSGGADYQMMSVEFADPQGDRLVTSQISCGRYVPGDWHEAVSFRPPAALQVACENGIAFVDLPNTLIWFDSAGRHMESLDQDRPVDEQMLVQFHRDVTSLVRRTTSLEDANQALCVVSAAMESYHQGHRYVFNDHEPTAGAHPVTEEEIKKNAG